MAASGQFLEAAGKRKHGEGSGSRLGILEI